MGYDEKRRQLGRKVLASVVEAHGAPSLHELARSTGASIPTLKHYFGDRNGAIAAALRGVEQDAAIHFQRLADPGKAKLGPSLRRVALELVTAWGQFGVGALFATGLAAGVGHETTGMAYVEGVLEPTIRALEARLRVHVARREVTLSPEDQLGIRTAALAFVSPLLVALLHQHELSGSRCRPLDVGPFIEIHVGRFTAAYGA